MHITPHITDELILANGIRELNRVGILDKKERIVS